jgi:hypothetical protein
MDEAFFAFSFRSQYSYIPTATQHKRKQRRKITRDVAPRPTTTERGKAISSKEKSFVDVV